MRASNDGHVLQALVTCGGWDVSHFADAPPCQVQAALQVRPRLQQPAQRSYPQFDAPVRATEPLHRSPSGPTFLRERSWSSTSWTSESSVASAGGDDVPSELSTADTAALIVADASSIDTAVLVKNPSSTFETPRHSEGAESPRCGQNLAPKDSSQGDAGGGRYSATRWSEIIPPLPLHLIAPEQLVGPVYRVAPRSRKHWRGSGDSDSETDVSSLDEERRRIEPEAWAHRERVAEIARGLLTARSRTWSSFLSWVRRGRPTKQGRADYGRGCPRDPAAPTRELLDSASSSSASPREAGLLRAPRATSAERGVS